MSDTRAYDYKYDQLSVYSTIVRKAFPQFNNNAVELAARLLVDGWHGSLEDLEYAVTNLTKEEYSE